MIRLHCDRVDDVGHDSQLVHLIFYKIMMIAQTLLDRMITRLPLNELLLYLYIYRGSHFFLFFRPILWEESVSLYRIWWRVPWSGKTSSSSVQFREWCQSLVREIDQPARRSIFLLRSPHCWWRTRIGADHRTIEFQTNPCDDHYIENKI